MVAERLLFRSAVRGRLPALLGLGGITALAVAFALTAATGARRTETAWPRLLENNRAAHAIVSVSAGDIDASEAILRARQDVSDVAAFSWMPVTPKEAGDEVIGLYAGIGPGFGETMFRPLIERGRPADPARGDEITINAPLAELTGLDVGDTTTLLGPMIEQPTHVVGIHRTALDIGPNGGAPSALATPAFMQRWWPVVQEMEGSENLRPSIGIHFKSGTDLTAALDAIAIDMPTAAIIGAKDLEADVKDGYRTQTAAYWILAAASALGAIVLLGLLVSRALRLDLHTFEVLCALGMTRPEVTRAASWPYLLVLGFGVALAPALTFVASPLVHTGFVEVADPSTGVWVDGPLLAAASASMAAVLAAAVIISAWRSTVAVSTESIAGWRLSYMMRAVRGSPAATIGVAEAVGGTGVLTRRSARSTLAAVMVCCASVVGALVWAANANGLAGDYRRQGWDFDVFAEGHPDTTEAQLADARAALLAEDGVVRLTRYERSVLSVGGGDSDLFAFTDERGSIHPPLVRGRVPAAPNEVVVGRATMQRLDIDIGERLSLERDRGIVQLLVVGEAVYPAIGNATYGDTVSMTLETMRSLGIERLESGYLIGTTPGYDVGQLQDDVGDAMTVLGPMSAPSVRRLREATGIDAALGWFFGVLTAMLAAYGLVLTSRRHARVYAVLRTLGFRRGQVLAAHLWQGAVMWLASMAIALPLGIVIGRTAWNASTGDVIALDRFSVPIGGLGLIALGVAFVIVVAAGSASLRAAHMTIATALRAE